MNRQISSASENHSTDFKVLIELLVQKFRPLQIHCFANFNITFTKRSCFAEAVDNCTQNYFLLLVTEETIRIEHEIQDFTNAHFKPGIVTIIAHNKKMVVESLGAGNRFFTNIYQRGTVLYCSDIIVQAGAIATSSTAAEFAMEQQYLDHRLLLIEGFFLGARECLCNSQYNACLFMLHQVVEQSCLALIRIHLGYRSDIHNLRRLLQLCCCFSNEPIKVFLSGSEEDNRLFNILVKSYSQTRYADHFLVDKEDLQSLYRRIEVFLELTRDMCNRKQTEANTE